jgi:dUTPase
MSLFTKLFTSARIPEKQSSNFDIDKIIYDLYSLNDGTIPSAEKGIVSTGIEIALPNDYFGQIIPHPHLSVRGIHACQRHLYREGQDFIIMGGDIPSTRNDGEIRLNILNINDTPFEYRSGEKIAQLILTKINTNHEETI